MTLPIEWGDLDRALFLLDGAEQALSEYGASPSREASELLDRHREQIVELRRQYVEHNSKPAGRRLVEHFGDVHEIRREP